jgi:hypothetical protein
MTTRMNKTDHHLYTRWQSIKQKCYNLKHPSYPSYGAKGVTVCDEWLEDFWAFADYIESLPGYAEGKYICLLDLSKNFYPGNIEMTTKKQYMQGRNKPDQMEL